MHTKNFGRQPLMYCVTALKELKDFTVTTEIAKQNSTNFCQQLQTEAMSRWTRLFDRTKYRVTTPDHGHE